jgi:hypothetical protein
VTPALLGASVGGLILITNAQTMLAAYDVSGTVREPVYAVLATVWALAAALVVRRLRREGAPLLTRGKTALAAEQAG